MHKYRFKENGMTLIEVMVGVALLSIVLLGMVSFMNLQARESRAINETLAKQDTEKFMIQTLADGRVCSAELTDDAQNPDNVVPGGGFTINATSPANLLASNIALTSIRTSVTPVGPNLVYLVRVGENPSPLVNSLVVTAINLTNFRALDAVAGVYQAEFIVQFNNALLVRPLQPISVKTTVYTDVLTPLGNRKIISCMGDSSAKSMCEKLGGTYNPTAAVTKCSLPAVYR